jgi:hypothetical protein
MTTSSAVIALRSLLLLQAQTCEWRQYTRQLEAAQAAGDANMVLEAMTGIGDVFRQLALAYTRLRTHVVAFDGAEIGDTIESFGELAIRGQMFIVTAQLRPIDTEIRSAMSGNRSEVIQARNLFFDRFGNAEGLAAFIRAEFVRLNALWVPHRKASATAQDATLLPSHVQRPARYLSAIRDVQHRLAALADESNLAPVLRSWTQLAEWPALQTAATMMTIALSINLTVEPDLLRSAESPGAMGMPAVADVPWDEQ